MLRFLTSVAVLAVCMFLVADGQGAEKKRRKKHGITAKILSIDLAKDSKDEGTLTIKVLARRKKKSAATAEAKEIKIEIKKDTKIERAGNRKKKEAPTAAVFADLQTDQVISFRLREGTEGKVADQIVIRRARKKKVQ